MVKILKILCLGHNGVETDIKTRQIAKNNNMQYNGLFADNEPILGGYYQTSICDIPYGDMIEIVTLFDELVILNQPIAEWTHPTAFYNTVRVAKYASKFMKVSGIDTTQTKPIEIFQQLVDTNKSFCIFPFIELVVNNNYTTVCCRSNKPITKLTDLVDYRTDSNYKEIREDMIAGTLLPEHCSTCYNYEALGIQSPRQQETVEWANWLNITNMNDLLNITSPAYYEIRASNTCNLQCRMCGPEYSSLLATEYKKLGLYVDDNISHTSFDIVNFSNLKKLYIAGGEPTAMPEFYKFLQLCIETDNTKFEFVVNTNANKISKTLFEHFTHFENLQFIISIDGFGAMNHYIRWPSIWDNIIQNVSMLNDNGHVVSFNVTVSIYNVTNLYELLKFFDDTFAGLIVHCQFADFKDNILSPFLFPDYDLVWSTLSQIPELQCYKNDPLLASFIDGLILQFSKVVNIDTVRLRKFFDFNDLLDDSRNIKLIDYNKELDSARKYIL